MEEDLGFFFLKKRLLKLLRYSYAALLMIMLKKKEEQNHSQLSLFLGWEEGTVEDVCKYMEGFKSFLKKILCYFLCSGYPAPQHFLKKN